MKSMIRLVLLMICTSAIFPAAAADWKVFNSYTCLPFGTTVAASLQYDAWGVTNRTGTTQQVVCPLWRDYSSSYSGANTLTVNVTFRAGSMNGTVYCATYETLKGQGSLTVSANPPWQQRWTAGEAVMTISSSPRVGQLSLVCTLTPQVTLGPIRMLETGDTTNT